MWLALTIGKQIILTKIAKAENTVAGQSTRADNMTMFQAWELSGLFPTLGNRLCPTAKLVFHVGIAFVKVWKSKQYHFPRMPVLWSPECSENN